MNIHPGLFSEVHNSLISHQGLTGTANTVMDPSLSEWFFLDVNTDNLKKKKQPFHSKSQYQNGGGWYNDFGRSAVIIKADHTHT